jgi:hypothetical protein
MLPFGSVVCADPITGHALDDGAGNKVSREIVDLRGSRSYDEFDFPLSILARLLASEIVPLKAKIKAVESWRREVAEARSNAPGTCKLEKHLATASRFLKQQRLKSMVLRALCWSIGCLRWRWTERTTRSGGRAQEADVPGAVIS